jgi:hypothetical protein
MRGHRQRGGCAPRPTGRGAPPHSSSVYLQPGVVVVWPGGWHLALASFGPPPLLPGPNDGSASADGASAPSNAQVDSAIAILLRSGLIQTSLVVLAHQRPSPSHEPGSKAAGRVQNTPPFGISESRNVSCIRHFAGHANLPYRAVRSPNLSGSARVSDFVVRDGAEPVATKGATEGPA